MNNHRLLAGLLAVALLGGGVCICAQSRRVMSIEDLFEAAESGSARLRQSLSAEAEAGQAVSVARSGRLPEINISLSASYIGDGFTTKRNFKDYQKAPIPHLGTGLSLNISQPVYTGGTITAGIELADLRSTAARYATELQRDNIRFRLTGYYLDLYKCANLRRVVERNIVLARKMLNEMRARYAQGVALQNDITRYELLVSNLELQRLKLDNTMAILNNDLVTTAGLSGDTEIVPDSTILDRSLPSADVEFTDNAQVQQQIVPVNSRVQGYISEIRFREYEPVHKGDTLVVIDDADMRLRVAQARADYQNALAGREVTGRSVGVASANVSVTEASVAEAKALMDMAAADLDRYTGLLAQDAVTRREYDAARTDYEAKKARYEMLARQRSATSSVVAETRQRIAQNEAGIELARALLETAELNLSYCVITAPCDGFASRKEIQVGQLVQPGQTLLYVVDSGDMWVTANYKETQLHHIAVGNDVDITVDAVPGVIFHGRVAALSRATGASLSLLPQDNSAGNFVKVRQRVPVRIEFTAENDSAAMKHLRAGMNVECEVRY